jgi:hypothetical protein
VWPRQHRTLQAVFCIGARIDVFTGARFSFFTVSYHGTGFCHRFSRYLIVSWAGAWASYFLIATNNS